MAGWTLEPQYSELAEDFGSLEAVFALQGERLTRDPLSEVIRVQRDGVNYYVKRYVGAGKGLRRYLGKPRVKMEWQNLKRFAKWGIPTAEVVAWGLERRGAAYDRGAMITRELPNTEDISALDIGLTRRDKLRFLKGYFQQPLRQILAEEAPLLSWLEGKANKLYARKQRYGDAL